MRTSGIEDMADYLEKELASNLSNMTLEEASTLARAFSQFLSFMGIAETHHRYFLNYFSSYNLSHGFLDTMHNTLMLISRLSIDNASNYSNMGHSVKHIIH